MKIVDEIFEKVERAGSQVIAVTKYFNAQETQEILEKVQGKPSFLALGENRIDDLSQKGLPRESVHFIGNLQSRRVEEIAKHCSVIHSLCDAKHAQLLNNLPNPPSIFIQINISRESQKSGILPENFSVFLQEIESLKNLKILGISAIGAGEFSSDEKRREFQELKKLRDEFLPRGKISAGTSRDFEIALSEGIEIVRIGQALFDL